MAISNKSQKPASQALKLTAAVLGAAALLGVIVCAGLIYWAFNVFSTDVPLAEATGNDFLDSLRSGQNDVAYANSTVSFKKKYSAEELGELKRRFPGLKNHQSRTFDHVTVVRLATGKEARLNVTLYTTDGPVRCTLILSQEGDQWKVEDIRLP
jgi:hypothetical protein